MEPLSILLASSVQFGYTVAVVGFLIVFAALTCLVIVFTNAPKFDKHETQQRKAEKEKAERRA